MRLSSTHGSLRSLSGTIYNPAALEVWPSTPFALASSLALSVAVCLCFRIPTETDTARLETERSRRLLPEHPRIREENAATSLHKALLRRLSADEV